MTSTSSTRLGKTPRGLFGRLGAFTLIELLIVVAIIAILAAIAVPNFLEAQTRSKVSRLLSDIRTIKTGVESYAVDFNDYPETDFGVTDITQEGVGLIRITTPIAFLTSIPGSPFLEEEIGNPGTPQNAVKFRHVLWVRAKASPSVSSPTPAGLDPNYVLDRQFYLLANVATAADFAILNGGTYMIKSVGPDNEDNRDTGGAAARVYDPTNGTLSPGDIVSFQDTDLPASQKK